jgi:F-type H+-transporting ATPase subunit gamma
VLHTAERFLREAADRGEQVEVHMAGKKGTQRFRFLGLPVAKVLPFGDDPTFAEIEGIAEELMRRHLAGEVKRVVVASMRLVSASVQKPAERQLLPISAVGWGEDAESVAPVPGGEGKGKKAEVDFILEPSRAAVLDAVIPLAVKNRLYGMVLEARASEQFARRIAMKLATDNAEEMIRSYTVSYNRHRQAGITAQIVEVVSGADAQG